MDREKIFKLMRDKNIKSVALQFIDFRGKLYTLWVPPSELEASLEHGVGMSGWPYFANVERSDLLIKPDLNSLRVLPWSREGRGYAGVMCDIYHPDTLEEVEESPRTLLKRATKKLKEKVGEDIAINAAPECEFFLLIRDENGKLLLHDSGSYFSPPPADKGYELRDDICDALERMGIRVSKNHHEDPRGRHELNIEYDTVLNMADKIQFVKWVIRKYANERGLIATFMPKPFDWEYGVGWHTHVSLMNEKTGENLFYSDKSQYGLSDLSLFFISGILKHAKALAAITNPTVNSYKRMVPGSQAPIYVSWSKFNRSTLLRIPVSPPKGTRFEYRPSDGLCNVFLSFTGLIYAGLDGIAKKEFPPPPLDENIYEIKPEDRVKRGIEMLPSNLGEALEEFKKDEVIRGAIEPLTDRYLKWKGNEWKVYSYNVYDWERETYLEENYPLEYSKHK